MKKKAIHLLVAASALVPATAAYADPWRDHSVDYGKPQLITGCMNGQDRTMPDFLMTPQWFTLGLHCA
jgi:hypothetical protein